MLSNMALLCHPKFDLPTLGNPQADAQELAANDAGDCTFGLVDRQVQPCIQATQKGHDLLARFVTINVDVAVVGVAHKAVASAFEFLVNLIEQDVRQQWAQRPALRRAPITRLDYTGAIQSDVP